MRKFLIKQPILGLIIFETACVSIVEVCNIIVNGKKITLPFKKKKVQKSVESVEE